MNGAKRSAVDALTGLAALVLLTDSAFGIDVVAIMQTMSYSGPVNLVYESELSDHIALRQPTNLTWRRNPGCAPRSVFEPGGGCVVIARSLPCRCPVFDISLGQPESRCKSSCGN